MLRQFYIPLIGACAMTLCWGASPDLPNRTLSLKGAGDYVELPSGILGPLTETTVEFWVKWDELVYYGQPIGFGESNQMNVFGFNNHTEKRTLQFFFYHQHQIELMQLPSFAQIGAWIHFALSAGPDGTRLICNGIVMRESDFSEGVSTIRNDTANYLGRSQWDGNDDFKGELDEVRVWDRVLSIQEIRKNLFSKLSGKEPGLVAYWNFDSGTAIDSTAASRDAVLMGNAACIASAIPKSTADITLPTVINGRVEDTFGNPLPGATVRIYSGNRFFREAVTDSTGFYTFRLIDECESPSMWCRWKTLGAWKTDLTIEPGINQTLLSKLKNEVHVTGSVTALDNTPQSGVAVQALRQIKPGEPFEIAQKTLSDYNGKFAFSNLRPGQYTIRAHTGHDFVSFHSDKTTSGETHTGVQSLNQGTLLKIETEHTQENIVIRFPTSTQGKWRSFTYLDGLGSSSIHSLHESADGMMWIGTASGIVRYDGKSFQQLSEPEAPHGLEIRSIAEAPNGVLWFATNNGVYRHAQDRFRHYATKDGLPSLDTHSLAVSESHELICGTTVGYCLFDGEAFRLPRSDQQVSAPVKQLTHLPNGSLFCLTPLSAVVINGSVPLQVSGKTSPASLVQNGTITCLLDSEHRVWFSTRAGISQHWIEDMMVHWQANLGSQDGLPDDSITSLLEDTNGSIWFGSERGEIYRLAPHGMTRLATPEGMASNPISVMYVQSNDNVWVGTLGGGLSLLERSTPQNFDRRQGLPALHASSVIEDQAGNLWFGFTGGGVSRYDGSQFQNYSVFDQHALSHNTITCLKLDPRGRIWAGTDDGFLGYAQDHRIQLLKGLDSQDLGRIGALEFIDERTVWVGSESGLHKITIDSTHPQGTIVESLLPNATILDIESTPQSQLWVATQNNGLHRFSLNDVKQFGLADGLPDAAIHDIYVSRREEIWSVTSQGIYKLEGEAFRRPDGDTSAWDTPCFSMTETKDGKLWIGTDSAGVRMFDGTHWNSLDRRDGIAGDSVFQILPDRDGSIWFATDGGLSRYRPEHAMPSLTIEAVEFDEPLHDEDEKATTITGSRIRFELQSIDFKTAPTKRRYHARVIPLPPDRSNPIQFQSVQDAESYEWIPNRPGDYRFEARALDRDLNPSPIASFEFKVENPWYLRATFIVPSVIAGAGILLAFVMLGTRLYAARRETRALNAKLLDQEREKNSELSLANERIEIQKEHLKQASHAKSAFLAQMSHEIRTPLHTVMGYANLLKKNPDLPHSQQTSADIIERSGKHLLTLVNEVLDLSKIEAGKANYQEDEFSLWECIQSLDAMFDLQCDQKGLGWQLDWQSSRSLQDSLPYQQLRVCTDEQKLKQILINLLNNAIKFTKAGEIRLRIKISEPAQASSKEPDANNEFIDISFEVSDTGVGIAREEHEAVLQPFQRGRSGEIAAGTGLGLSIASRLVEILGGTLRLESELGKGSTFSFQLRQRRTATADERPGKKLPEIPKQLTQLLGTRAVIAEDHDVNRNLFAEILDRLSIEVTCAADGVEAIEAVNRARPDIVFLDIHMPRMDGIAACRQIREHHLRNSDKGLPLLVAVSAAAFNQDKQECLDAGFDAFVPKPFDEDQIHSTLAHLLPQACVYESKTSAAHPEASVRLTEDLLRELKEAADIGSVGDIERVIQNAVPDESQLPRELSEILDLCQCFDFAGIRDALHRLSSRES